MSALDVMARGLAARALHSFKNANRLDRLRTALVTARDTYPVMTSPPIVTMPATNVSQISGLGNYAVSVPATDARLTYVGGRTQVVSTNRMAAATMTGLDGNRLTNGLMRMRFMTDAPQIELCFRAVQSTFINAIIDGAMLSRANGALPQSNGPSGSAYWMMDFGTDPTNFFLNQLSRVSAGTGYVVGDILTLAGGTFTRAAKLRITTASGGVIVEDGGDYSVVPTGTLTTTGGSGTGFTVNNMIWSRAASPARRMRRIELLIDIRDLNGYVAGLVVPPGSTILAWPVADGTPKLLVIGDSQNAGTYQAYPDSQSGYQIAQRLGLMDAVEIQAQGGTGWVTANGNSAPWSTAGRVADMIAAKPDILLFDGSQNDGTRFAEVTTAAAASLHTLQAALPDTLFLVCGPVLHSSGTPSYVAALAAAVAQAPDPRRIALINNSADGWFSGSGKNTAPSGSGNNDIYVSSDGAHLTQAGIDYRATILAERMRVALLGLVQEQLS